MNATAGSHERFEELAAGYSLGALEPDEEMAFTAHLMDCQRCAALTAEFGDISADLAAVSDDTPAPPGLWDKISAAVANDTHVDAPQVASLDAQRSKPAGRRRLPLLAAAAASVGVLALAGVVATTQFRGSTDSPAGTAAIAQCRDDAACRVLELVSRDNRADAVALLRGSDVTLVSTGLAAIDPRTETYVLWQMPDQGFPTAVLAFAVTSDSKHPVATGRLPLPAERGLALAVSREKGTTIPATPAEPVVRTNA